MMLLNSGIALKRPGESPYATIRRFAIANPAQTYRSIKAMVSMPGKDNKQVGAHIQQLVHRLESEQQRRYHAIDGATTASATLSTQIDTGFSITRNCPRCAALGYHSMVYELPWLSHCPLHGDELMTRCPRCHHAWPAISLLWSRDCPLCGGRTPLSALLSAGAFNDTADFSRISQLQTVIDTAHRWRYQALCAFENDGENEYVHATRTAITVEHPLYPSIANHLHGKLYSRAFPVSVSLQRCRCFRFECLPYKRNNPPSLSRGETKAVFLFCKKMIERKIKNTIARSVDCIHRLRYLDSVRAYGDHVPCVYCAAYSIWQSLLESTPTSSFIQRGFLGRQLYDLADPPTVPLCWQAIALTHAYAAHDIYSLPLSAQRLLYAIDLWTTFVNIFRYVHYKYTNVLLRRSDHFYDAENAAQSSHSTLAFWIAPDATFTVCIPHCVVRPVLTSEPSDHGINDRTHHA